jgi:ribose 5-phosphate isomerase RpiB
MKIALVMENSQAAKNPVVEKSLRNVVEPMGHEVFNYGMYSAEDKEQLTYVQVGILTAVLLNSGAADYVITGCGTGEGAMLACNSFPGVICGHVEDALDAYTFSQINDGNAISLPFAKGFGWGGEKNLEYIFEKLYCEESGQGYPRERAAIMKKNREILNAVKGVTYRDLCDILKEIDRDLVKGALAGAKFQEYFFANCKCEKLAEAVKEILA